MRLLLLVLIVGSAIGFVDGRASAHPLPCADRAVMREYLKAKYSEKLVSAGLVDNGATNQGLLEIYVSASGTWTAVLSNSAGMSCVSYAGLNWKDPSGK